MDNCWQKKGKTNCAAVAIIKVALMQFGPGDPFKKLIRKRRSWHITLRDGKRFIISDSALNSLTEKMHIDFTPEDEVEEPHLLIRLERMVKLCYGVMLLYLQRYGVKGKTFSLKKAKQKLKWGATRKDKFNADDLYLLLGLERRTVDARDLEKKHLRLLQKRNAFMLYNWRHVVAGSRGWYDRYGTQARIGTKRKIGKAGKALFWYEVK